MTNNLRSATGNVIHAASDYVAAFGSQPKCTPLGQVGSDSFCRYYETNAKIVTCKKCIKKIAAESAVEIAEVAPVVEETVDVEVTETIEVAKVSTKTTPAYLILSGYSFILDGQVVTALKDDVTSSTLRDEIENIDPRFTARRVRGADGTERIMVIKAETLLQRV